MALALFDLDHTLLDGDSNSLWMRYLIDRGLLDAATLTTQAGYLMQYAAETLDIVEYLDFHLGLLRDKPLEAWLPVRDAFIAQEIRPRLPEAAITVVKEHRLRGDHAAIITATHHFLSAGIGDLFEMPVIAPCPRLRDDRVAGVIESTICYRERKIDCLEVFLAREDWEAPDEERHFYSDSINDLPLLAAVGHPHVVNPDARLAVEAAARGWPVLSWKR
ncbi:MAG: HAD-IB family phosphatase [Propionivibrio sp.]